MARPRNAVVTRFAQNVSVGPTGSESEKMCTTRLPQGLATAVRAMLRASSSMVSSVRMNQPRGPGSLASIRPKGWPLTAVKRPSKYVTATPLTSTLSRMSQSRPYSAQAPTPVTRMVSPAPTAMDATSAAGPKKPSMRLNFLQDHGSV